MLILFSRNNTYVGDPPIWVVNTLNSCHSRYTNYNFESFFKFKDDYYGCNQFGIYKLTGDKDSLGNDTYNVPAEDADIVCTIETIISDMDKQETKSVEDAIINARSTNTVEVYYSVNESDWSNPLSISYKGVDGVYRQRVKVPRGPKGTNWQFKIQNTEGASLTLFDFEIRTRTNKRIV